MLDDRGVHALGKVSEERKLAELARADVLCAPSLRRRELRHDPHRGVRDGHARGRLGHPRLSRRRARRHRRQAGAARRPARAGATRCDALALDRPRRERMALAARERAERFAWPHVAAEVLDTYEQAVSLAAPARRQARSRLTRAALRSRLRAGGPAAARARAALGVIGACARPADRTRAAHPRAATRRPRRDVSGRRRPRSAGAGARRRDTRGSVAARVQAGAARRGPCADVRGDVHPRDRLARDPRRRRPPGAAPNAATRCRERSSAC